MPRFTVDTDIIRSKANELDQLAGDYARISLNLRNVATSMGSAYISADNTEYTKRIIECCGLLDAMAKKLSYSAELLNNMAKQYDDREQNNLFQARKLPSC
jgi:hypothetical protein